MQEQGKRQFSLLERSVISTSAFSWCDFSHAACCCSAPGASADQSCPVLGQRLFQRPEERLKVAFDTLQDEALTVTPKHHVPFTWVFLTQESIRNFASPRELQQHTRLQTSSSQR